MRTLHVPCLCLLVGLVPVVCKGQTTRPASHPIRVLGTLDRVVGGDLLVRPLGNDTDSSEVLVPTDAATRFNVDLDVGSITDLRPGMQVSVVEGMPHRGDKASSLNVSATTTGVFGTISKVEGHVLTLQVVSRETLEVKDVRFETDGRTRVIFMTVKMQGQTFKGGEKTVNDLKVGMGVRVLSVDGKATKIIGMAHYFPPTTRGN